MKGTSLGLDKASELIGPGGRSHKVRHISFVFFDMFQKFGILVSRVIEFQAEKTDGVVGTAVPESE